MNRQIHHWLVVDFESNERDPRDTGYNSTEHHCEV
jgi:hypothetical protein